MDDSNTLRLVPLDITAYELARQFESEQLTPQTGRRVYLNTLAVYAVYMYLQWLQIEVDLSRSDSWNLGKRTLFNVADLFICNFGKLECRPVLPGETKIYIPPEVSEDRVGYVVVRIDESSSLAYLLGFTNVLELNEEEEMSLESILPFETLFEVILEESNSVL